MSTILIPTFTRIVENLKGAEGPVFDSEGNFFVVAPEHEIDGKPAGQIFTVDLSSKKAKLLCAPEFNGYGGIPAGCQVDKQGKLWVADMRHGVLKVDTETGDCTQICETDTNGHQLQGCNDCIFDYDGTLWVTAPAGKIAPEPYTRSFEAPFGSIYCLTKDKMILTDMGYWFPNGIAVKHSDEGKPQLLIVAETPKKILWAFDIVAPGIVENKRLWANIPGNQEGGPDGMDFDCKDNLLVANWGSFHIDVFGPNGGDPIYRIKCPFSKVSNLHFKPKSKEVYVTEHDTHAVWQFEWLYEGKPQYCDL